MDGIQRIKDAVVDGGPTIPNPITGSLGIARTAFFILLGCFANTTGVSFAREPATAAHVIELGPMKAVDSDKFNRAMETVQKLELEERKLAYSQQLKELKEQQHRQVFFRVNQSLGWGQYLVRFAVESQFTGPSPTFHLTLLDDRLQEGGIADGEVIGVVVEQGGVYQFENTHGVQRSVRKLREVKPAKDTPKPTPPQQPTKEQVESLLRDGKHYVLTKKQRQACPKCEGSKLIAGIKCPTCDGKGRAFVTARFKLVWGKDPNPPIPTPGVPDQGPESDHSEIGKMFQIREHDWANGDGAAKLMPAENGVACISSISGRFGGGVEGVEVSVGADGNWHFIGKSKQWLRAKVMTVEPTGKNLFGPVRTVAWKGKGPAIRLVESKKGFAYLSAVSGEFLAGETYVRVWLDPDGWWYLQGDGPATGAATVVEWVAGLTPPEVITYSWTKGDGPVRMIHQDDGFCFLSMMAGGFNGGGERLHVYIDDDGFWKLAGHTGRTLTRGSAVALRFSGNTKAPVSDLFGAENEKNWETKGGTWEFHPDQLIGYGNGGITLSLNRKPPLSIDFEINVLSGLRPRVQVAGTTLGNEGSKRTLALYPRKGVERITEKGNEYTSATPMKISLKVREDGVEYYRDGELWEKRDYKIDSIPSIRFSCGDSWSAGTISIRGLSVN
ncbi:hypothetical protein HZ994_11530 [Akkermansiaceae bacterium]|nr:hypothetical protein HZ994_11530 [Akkermansiaceae bacterium]